MNDNVDMMTFDDIEIRRPDLAENYLTLLRSQPGRPIALFAPRRVGKTHFLDHDLTPAAKKAGLLPVYADVWLHRSAPLMAINHALEEALDDIDVPKSTVGKIAKTPIRKVGGLGASLEFGDEPQRRALPDNPELRLDALIARLFTAAGKPILLMLDEIQALGESGTGNSAIATLRAVLHKRKHQVAAVFTGSSQEALSEMMTAAGGPMYQFAQLLNFPFLDDAYLILLAEHYKAVHPGKRLDVSALRELFVHIGFKPALMKDIVKDMSAEGITDVGVALKRFVTDDRQVAGWQAALNSLQPLEQAVLVVLAHKLPPMGKETIALITNLAGVKATLSKVRTILDRLRKAGILAKGSGDGYLIEDRLFADHIIKTH